METFDIVPVSARPLWILGGVCVLLALVVTAMALVAWGARHSRVEVTQDQVRLVGDFFGRSIPVARLRPEDARIVDLNRDARYRPVSRRLGTGLPGYSAGWFRLANDEKALLYLTRRAPVVYLPTREGYSLLLSVDDPQAFIRAVSVRSASGAD